MLKNCSWKSNAAPKCNDFKSTAASESKVLYKKGQNMFQLRTVYVSGNEWLSLPRVVTIANKNGRQNEIVRSVVENYQ